MSDEALDRARELQARLAERPWRVPPSDWPEVQREIIAQAIRDAVESERALIAASLLVPSDALISAAVLAAGAEDEWADPVAHAKMRAALQATGKSVARGRSGRA